VALGANLLVAGLPGGEIGLSRSGGINLIRPRRMQERQDSQKGTGEGESELTQSRHVAIVAY